MESPTRFRLAVASAALAGCAVGGVAFGPAFAGALQDDDTTSTTTAEDPTETTDSTVTDDTTADDGTTDDTTADDGTTSDDGTADDGTTSDDGTADDGTTSDDGTADGEDCGPGDGRGGPGGGHFGPRPAFEAAAEAIGIEVEDLRTALADGQTIAEVAEANGVAVEDVIAAMVTEAQEQLAAAVADGRIDQDRADEISATLEERITDQVNGEFEMRGPGMGHRGPGDEAPPAPDSTN